MVMQLGRRLGSAEAREILGCALQKREKGRGGGGRNLGPVECRVRTCALICYLTRSGSCKLSLQKPTCSTATALASAPLSPWDDTPGERRMALKFKAPAFWHGNIGASDSVEQGKAGSSADKTEGSRPSKA